MAGFDLTFSPSKSVSVAWALADRDTKAQIYACHRRAIEVVLTYAEREVFHSRSGTNGVVQEDIEGVVAAAFTHWDSRAGDPQLHDHVVVANRARSVSDGDVAHARFPGPVQVGRRSLRAAPGRAQRSVDRGVGVGLGRASPPPFRAAPLRSDRRLRGPDGRVLPALGGHRGAQDSALIGEFVAAHGRQPTTAEVLELRRRATLETRPAKEHHSLAEMTGGWRRRAERYIGDDQISWVAGLADRNDLPLLHAGDLADGILADAAGVAVERVAERRATFSRANVLAEVHRQLHGVRFASPEDRIAVAERTADLALAQSLLISAPELHHTPERLRRADGTSRFRAKGHEVYTTATLLEAEARLLDAGRQIGGPAVTARHGGRRHRGQPARPGPRACPSTRPWRSSRSPRRAADSTSWSGRPGRASPPRWPGCVPPGKPSTARVRCSVSPPLPPRPRCWPANSASTPRTPPNGSTSTAEKPNGWARSANSAPQLRSLPNVSRCPGAAAPAHHRRRGRAGPLAPPSGPAGDRRRGQPWPAPSPSTSWWAPPRAAGAKVVLVGDQGQLSAVEAGGMFAALVRDRDGLAPELTDVRRFHHLWEKRASVELRRGSPDAIDAYQANERIADGDRDQMLDALYLAWKDDTESGQTSLMIAGDLGTVSELNDRARADRVAAGAVSEHGLTVAGGGTAGVGDLVVTRQNDRRLSTGRRWVRNGDRWIVTATHTMGR